MNSPLRRLSTMRFVGWPAASSSQWHAGYSYGDVRMGWSKKLSVMRVPLRSVVAVASQRESLHPDLPRNPESSTLILRDLASLASLAAATVISCQRA